ncbi:MAG TPA: YceD family protein [Casimicrobiaceae bacterium]|nr:YceD family protein [Casimicrobiaceae bacterium]
MQPTSRRFDAYKLAQSQGRLEGHVAPSSLPRLVDRIVESSGDDQSTILAWTIDGTSDEEGRPAIRVTVAGSVAVECQRCLETLEQPVDASTLLLLARDEEDLVHLDEVSEHEVVLANAKLDALALVEDELLLSLPFAPRHASCLARVPAARVAGDANRPG